MTSDPQPQQASTLNYGDVVLYQQNNTRCPAMVLQSQVVAVPDRAAPGGIRQEEHLTLVYLNPFGAKQVLSQIQMDEAISRAFGVQELSETNKNGWIRCKVIAETGTPAKMNANAQEQNESSYEHAAQTG